MQIKPASLHHQRDPARAPPSRQASAGFLLGRLAAVQRPVRRAVSLGPTPSTTTTTTARSVTRTLERAISGFLGAAVRETVWCQICFENVPLAATVRLERCGHRFCAPCLKKYLELQIQNGNVFPVCFHPVDENGSENQNEDESQQQNKNKNQINENKNRNDNTKTKQTCNVPVVDTQIQQLVDSEHWAKRELFRFNQSHALARECPFCSRSQECVDGPTRRAVICEHCSREFCFVHGDAHANETCADFELRHAESEAQSRATIARVANCCPGCRANVEKAGGCNHMTCIACRTEFCWICSEVLTRGGVSDHYSQLRNASGCGGRQFDQVTVDGRVTLWSRVDRAYSALHYRLTNLIFLASYFVFYPVAYLIALLIAGPYPVPPFSWLSKSKFEDVLEAVRIGFGFVGIFGAIFWVFRVLPEWARNCYLMTTYLKLLVDLGPTILGSVREQLEAAWSWVSTRTGLSRDPEQQPML